MTQVTGVTQTWHAHALTLPHPFHPRAATPTRCHVVLRAASLPSLHPDPPLTPRRLTSHLPRQECLKPES
ncbi:hypothetical protein E2C01_090350 [Portunus trituberculatus]|uniref:Uncharacterized protein n=1 Tax=Portunus trituberculatus TaxID=210409 RepID=A0A5B7JS02_PORTR|nr:hypothetical protein [Portunus trituberculatus]